MDGLGIEGKTVVIVGASSGWGRGAAKEFAGQGARVVVNGRNPDAVRHVVEEIQADGGVAMGYPAAVHTSEGAAALTSAALEHFGDIDVLVNSSGGKVTGTIVELSEEAFDESIDSQLRAPFLTTHHVAKAMVASDVRGRIINMAGGASVRPLYAESLHCATKGGLLAATWTWALELEPYGITVNAVRGGVRSNGTEPLIARMRERLGAGGSKISDRELGFYEAEEVASLLVWLASPATAAITGQFIGIDGPKLTVWDLPMLHAQLFDVQGWDYPHLDSILRPVLERATDRARQESQVMDSLKLVGAPSSS
jgi:NAD(P)-dependent dehydrogenase (short-subunit alcohol dehydrogenase family)